MKSKASSQQIFYIISAGSDNWKPCPSWQGGGKFHI